MKTNQNTVKFRIDKNGFSGECREEVLSKVIIYIGGAFVVNVLIFYASKCFMPVLAKCLDRKINKDDKDTKGIKEENNKQNSSQITMEEKEEPLTDFSRPITKGEKVEFLFDKFIPKNGITVLAAAKGIGKSGMCMQIAQNLAKVGKYPLFNTSEVKETTTVIYADYELNEDQIQTRYPSLQNNNYFRWGHVSNPTSTHLLCSLRNTLNNIQTTSALVVIDNLSKINGTGSAEKAKQFYKELEGIRAEYNNKGVSIAFILVAHLELEKNSYKEITPGDMTGAASIYYYADAVLAIGTAREQNTIYLKELEIRDRTKEENVYVFKRNSSDWLHYEFVDMKTEREALPVKSGDKNNVQPLNEETKIEEEIIKRAKNLSNEEIEALKNKVPKEKKFRYMCEEKKKAVRNKVKELKNVANETRHGANIILLRDRIYISHATVNKIWGIKRLNQ